VSTCDNCIDGKWFLWLLHCEHTSGEVFCVFLNFGGSEWLWFFLSLSVADSKGLVQGLVPFIWAKASDECLISFNLYL
jgi:hypothetical protein